MNKCTDCKGTGKITLLNTIVDCECIKRRDEQVKQLAGETGSVEKVNIISWPFTACCNACEDE